MEHIEQSKVQSVYSGKQHACYCGCSGKYSYAKQYQGDAGKARGYPVQDDEVNDVMVGKVTRFINEHLDQAETIAPDESDRILIVTVPVNEKREYTAYVRVD